MKRKSIRDKNSGTALIFACIFSVILAIGIGGYLAFVTGQAYIVKHHANYGSAFYLAEAGIEKAIIELENYAIPPNTFPGIDEANLGDGTYRVLSADARYADDLIKYELHSIGNVNDVEREVVMEVQTESFAKWSYFSTDENYLIHIWWWRWHWVIEVPVWFTTGSYLEGPVHTNGQFNVSGYPVFNSCISSVSDSINYMHGPDEDGIKFYDDTCEGYCEERDRKFEPDELNLGVEEIDVSLLNADRLREAALEAYDPGGMEFTGDTNITFLEDGTMNVTNSDRGWVDHNISQPSAITVSRGDGVFSGNIDTENICFERGNLDISGTINTQKIYVERGNLNISDEIKTSRIFVNRGNLNITGVTTIDTENGAMFAQRGDLVFGNVTIKGTVTAGASKDVIITDDIMYDTDPRENPDAGDKLGIISEGNVIIDKDAPQDADPPDPEGVTIHASIIAIDESFTVEQYWNGIKEILTVFGGIIQTRRGPVGTFYASPYRKASGYDKNYQYDQRMRYSPPPYFPYTGEYETVYWKEEIDED